jgi:hypothetical protein
MKIYLVETGMSRQVFKEKRAAVDALVRFYCCMFGRLAFDDDKKARVRSWLETDASQPLTLAFKFGLGAYAVIPLHLT